uniref:C2H2-type domain-containing protein n=1 Tax=Riboviria sp. TaxID=2585031 RepID=A0A8K1WRH5_9VIRU|nr:MAG: hypothetical protein 1 [Riboviria sp.]
MSVHGDQEQLVGGGAARRPIYIPPPGAAMIRVREDPEAARQQRQRVEADLDQQLSRVYWWAFKALIALGMVGALCLATISAFALAWRWFVHGLKSLRGYAFAHATEMYGWLDQYSPSETPEERVEKFTSLRTRILGLANVDAFHWIPWESVDIVDWTLLLAVAVLAAVGIWGSLCLVTRLGRRAVLRLRGVQLEAMIPGSLFTPAKTPDCQIQILLPGLLTDAHQGYGVRVKSYLVTNKHVVAGHPELVLRGPSGKKILVNPSYAQSRLSEDLVYMHLPESLSAQLGVKASKGSSTFASNFATCVGPSGASSGRLSRSNIRGKLIFEGSTTPGMSGAPYLIAEVLAGIHQGAAGHSNVGIAVDIIRAEIARLVCIESKDGESPGKGGDQSGEYQNRFKASWGAREIEEMADERYANDSWANSVEDDADFWTQKLVFESRRAPTAARPVAVTVSNQDGSAVSVPLNLQNEAGTSTVLDLIPATHVDYVSQLMNQRLLERVTALERKVAELEARQQAPPAEKEQPPLPADQTYPSPIGPNVRFPCDHCTVTCRTEARLLAHVGSAHPLLPESAIPEDTGASGKVVKQGKPFLGKRASQKKKRSNSPNTSPVRVGHPESRSLEASLSQMLESQRSTELLLRRFLQASAGQSSGIMQK